MYEYVIAIVRAEKEMPMYLLVSTRRRLARKLQMIKTKLALNQK